MGNYKIDGVDLRELVDNKMFVFNNEGTDFELSALNQTFYNRFMDVLEYLVRATNGDREIESKEKAIEILEYIGQKCDGVKEFYINGLEQKIIDKIGLGDIYNVDKDNTITLEVIANMILKIKEKL